MHKANGIRPDVVDVNLEPVDLADIYQRLVQYYGPQSWWPASHAFEVIVGAILTQNTAWRNVELALENLRHHRLLSCSSMMAISFEELMAHIRPAGFYRRKAECLKSICGWLNDQHGLDNIKQKGLSDSRKTLLNIRGIGQETADAILLYALDKPVFVIDKYTHRLVSRLANNDMAFNYDALQNSFINSLDENLLVFQEYHALIVVQAKEFCKKTPDCTGCPLNDSCRHYRCTLRA